MSAARRSRARSALVRILLGLALLAAGLVAAGGHVAAAEADLGCGEELVEQQLGNGSAWRLCVRIQPYQGLTLESVEFRPATGEREYAGYKRVLDSLTLAQLHVDYDNGETSYDDVTDYGLGGDHLLSQTAQTCTGTIRPVRYVSTRGGTATERTLPGICLGVVGTGLAYESQEWSTEGGPRYAMQGNALRLASLSKVGWYEYEQSVTLDDQGGIDVGLGATGDLAPGNAPGVFFSTDPTTGWPIGPAGDGATYYATSHWHDASYRVDFGIDAGAVQQVQQWDYVAAGQGSTAVLGGTPTTHERAFLGEPSGDYARLSWWRVLNPSSLNPDGHPRSYEIVNDSVLDVDSALAAWPVAFTNAEPCQQFASYNLDPGCPNQSVLDYVAEDDAPLTDPVAWVNVDFHHVDRDEDQSPMPTHWQHFRLIPRDFFGQGPATPDARSCVNGAGLIDSNALPCIATNQKLPTITASTSPAAAGTTLTATPGTWNEARTTWDYAYLWFRDGSAITGTDADGLPTAATASSYVLTTADVGHAITVKVTASHPGYVSGTAESAALEVPGPADQAEATTGAVPTAAAATAAPSRITVVPVKRTTVGRRARLAVLVTTPGATATGRVVASVRGKHGRARLVEGRAVLLLPRLREPGRYRLRIRYSGADGIAPSRRVVVLAVARER
ncbi:hypothetical protein [Nocardioides sp.]|uniref:copper amine oxidase n=1 Tax=Nocardioides sp. TaxID=35761 RepID=UPI0039E5FCE0